MKELTPDDYDHPIDSRAALVCPDDDCRGPINLDKWHENEELECYYCGTEYTLHLEEVNDGT